MNRWTSSVVAAALVVAIHGSAVAQSNSKPTSAAQKSGAMSAKRANGQVTAVDAKSITVKVAGKDMMFAVDASTTVVAKGAGTKADAHPQGQVSIVDHVKVGDTVTVSYHDMGGMMHAAEVRVTKQGTVK